MHVSEYIKQEIFLRLLNVFIWLSRDRLFFSRPLKVGASRNGKNPVRNGATLINPIISTFTQIYAIQSGTLT